MPLTQLKLQPTPAQADALRRTLERANAACNYLSECAWTTQTFRQFDLHKLCYRDVRQRFGLAAQVTVRSDFEGSGRLQAGPGCAADVSISRIDRL